MSRAFKLCGYCDGSGRVAAPEGVWNECPDCEKYSAVHEAGARQERERLEPVLRRARDHLRQPITVMETQQGVTMLNLSRDMARRAIEDALATTEGET